MINNKTLILSVDSIINPVHACWVENIIFLLRKYVDQIYVPNPLDKNDKEILSNIFSIHLNKDWENFPFVTSLCSGEEVIFCSLSSKEASWEQEKEVGKHKNITLYSNKEPPNEVFKENVLVSENLPDEIDREHSEWKRIGKFVDSGKFVFLPPIIDQIQTAETPKAFTNKISKRILFICDKNSQNSLPINFELHKENASITSYDIERCSKYSDITKLKRSIANSTLIVSAHSDPTFFHYTLQICNLLSIGHKLWHSLPASPYRFVFEQNIKQAEYFLNQTYPKGSLRSQYSSILNYEPDEEDKHESGPLTPNSKDYFIHEIENITSRNSESIFPLSILRRKENAAEIEFDFKKQTNSNERTSILTEWISNPFVQNALIDFDIEETKEYNSSLEILNLIYIKVWETIIYSDKESSFLFNFKKKYIIEREITKTINDCLRLRAEHSTPPQPLDVVAFIKSIWCKNLLESLWDSSFVENSRELVDYSISILKSEMEKPNKPKKELIGWYMSLFPFSKRKDDILKEWDSLESELDDRTRATLLTLLLRNLFFAKEKNLFDQFLKKDLSLEILSREDLLLFAIFSYLSGFVSKSREAYSLLHSDHRKIFLNENISRNRNYWIMQGFVYKLNGQESISEEFFIKNTDQTYRSSTLLKLLSNCTTKFQNDSFKIPSFDLNVH